MNRDLSAMLRDIVIGTCVSGLLAMGVKFFGLPQRVSVLEAAFQSVDKKLDILIEKVH